MKHYWKTEIGRKSHMAAKETYCSEDMLQDFLFVTIINFTY
jgi:hypothetical protein